MDQSPHFREEAHPCCPVERDLLAVKCEGTLATTPALTVKDMIPFCLCFIPRATMKAHVRIVQSNGFLGIC